MKIYSFPFAVTIESALTIAEMELLQKHDPRALALRDVMPNGEEFETFRIGYSPIESGSVNANGVTFVGETENGKAALSILIPATLKGEAVGNYIDNKLAAVSRNIAIVEANAKKAVVDVKAAKEVFLKSIVPLKPAAAKEAAPTCESKCENGKCEVAPSKKEGGKK